MNRRATHATPVQQKEPAMDVHAAVITEPGVVTTIPAVDPAPDIHSPPPGWAFLRPVAVGICGSDVHYFHGDIGALTGASEWYPRIPGHEVAAVVEVVGDGVSDPRLRPGALVAVWPLETCGQCYPCRRGKENACAAMRILGVHRDGGMAGRMLAPAGSLFPVPGLAPGSAAFIEPMSVAVHALAQAGVRENEAAGLHLLVLGGGPIGQAVLLAATAWGASVAVVDPRADRRARAADLGAVTTSAPDDLEAAAVLRRWGRGPGADVVVDTTGAPPVLQHAADLVAPTGVVVAVGLTGGSAPFSPGVLPEKEITVVGSSCATRADFASAVRLVQSHPEAVAALVSHVVPLERAAEAFELAQRSDVGTMKVVVSVP